jgi:hypothetical protein
MISRPLVSAPEIAAESGTRLSKAVPEAFQAHTFSKFFRFTDLGPFHG